MKKLTLVFIQLFTILFFSFCRTSEQIHVQVQVQSDVFVEYEFPQLYEKIIKIIRLKEMQPEIFRESQILTFKFERQSRELLAMLFVKKPDSFRVKAVTSDGMGITVFDVVKFKDKVQYKSQIPQLNRPVFISTVSSDIYFVYFHPELFTNKIPVFKVENGNYMMQYQIADNVIQYVFHGKYLYLISKSCIKNGQILYSTEYLENIYKGGFIRSLKRKYVNLLLKYSIDAVTRDYANNPEISPDIFQI